MKKEREEEEIIVSLHLLSSRGLIHALIFMQTAIQ